MSDLIDRKILLAKFEDICEMCGKRDENSGVMCRCCYLDDAISMTEDLPSAEPERKTGRWEVQPSTGEDRPFIWWKCSECGHVIFSETERDRREFHAFCGRCGADMRGKDEKA